MSTKASELVMTPLHRVCPSATVVETSDFMHGKAEATGEPVFASSKRQRVLIIDDEEDAANNLRLGLDRYGFDCDVYTDPVEAVRNFQPGMYDVILCDVRMPRMNGFHVYRELMAKARGKARIYLLSDIEIDEEEFGALFPEIKVGGFLNKPRALRNLSRDVYQLASTVSTFSDIRR